MSDLSRNAAPAVEALAEIARMHASPAGHVAAILADFVAETNHRLALVELALLGMAYEPVEETPREAGPATTVFGIPVVLRDGKAPEHVLEAIEGMPRGLTKWQVIDELVAAGIITGERR